VVNKAIQVKDNMVAAMMLQLHAQTTQQAMMQRELQEIKSKLDRASVTLAQKDQIIDSLEQDLEHMIDQIGKIQTKQNLQADTNAHTQWMSRPLPGFARNPNQMAS
jgi:chromosome segregation ATPase